MVFTSLESWAKVRGIPGDDIWAGDVAFFSNFRTTRSTANYSYNPDLAWNIGVRPRVQGRKARCSITNIPRACR
jgi:hypothetical protein